MSFFCCLRMPLHVIQWAHTHHGVWAVIGMVSFKLQKKNQGPARSEAPALELFWRWCRKKHALAIYWLFFLASAFLSCRNVYVGNLGEENRGMFFLKKRALALLLTNDIKCALTPNQNANKSTFLTLLFFPGVVTSFAARFLKRPCVWGLRVFHRISELR